MKLAEALAIRADLQTKISQISARLIKNAKVQEGEKPSENPYDLLDELNDLTCETEKLIKQINYTNCVTIKDGVSLADMIAKKDMLKKKVSIIRNFLSNAGELVDRYSNKEIKIKSTVDVAKLQKDVDAMSKQLRELDMKIQETNWTTELIEK